MSPQGYLPKGGCKGYVEFKFDDGWTIFLTSKNGAKDFDSTLVHVINAEDKDRYGGEYDMDPMIAKRLKRTAEELNHCRLTAKPVVLHCNHGRTRSVVCLGAYLLMRNYFTSAINVKTAIEACFVSANAQGKAHCSTLGERVERALDAFQIMKNA